MSQGPKKQIKKVWTEEDNGKPVYKADFRLRVFNARTHVKDLLDWNVPGLARVTVQRISAHRFVISLQDPLSDRDPGIIVPGENFHKKSELLTADGNPVS